MMNFCLNVNKQIAEFGAKRISIDIKNTGASEKITEWYNHPGLWYH